MSDQPTDSNEELEIPRFEKGQIEKEQQRGIWAAQTKHDLKTNPRYKSFFEQYEPKSVEEFIDHYATMRARYVEYGELYVKIQDDVLLRFDVEGQERLWDIQLKKLFNIEQRWRAEEIELKEIELTYDFIYWWDHIEECPFVDPITEDEVALYCEYVLSENFEQYPEYNIHTIRWSIERGDDNPYYPEWFEFYDIRYGTAALLSLPDKRGAKEHYYMGLENNESRKQESNKEPKQPVPPKDNRPKINTYDREFMESFIKQFEDSKLLKYCRALEGHNEQYSDEDLEEAIELLKSAGEPIHAEEADDWREAIMKTSEEYYKRMLAKGVRNAYNDYLMRRANGVGYGRDGERSDETFQWLKKEMTERIIKGRVLNGEPPDLKF